MRSSISVTKILTFCFILLILILKAKLCVSFVSTSGGVSSDDSLQSAVQFVEPQLNVSSSDVTSVVNFSAKHELHQHASAMPRAHRVRHKHHHMKIRHTAAEEERTRRGYKSNAKFVNSKVDKLRHNVHPRSHNNRHQRVSSHHLHQRGGSRKIHTHSSHGSNNHNNSWQHIAASGNSSFPMQRPTDEQKTTARTERVNLSKTAKPSSKDTRLTSQSRSHGVTTVTPAKQSPVSGRASSGANSLRTSSISRRYFEDLLHSYQGKLVLRSHNRLRGDDDYAYDEDEGDNDEYDDDDDDDDDYDEDEDDSDDDDDADNDENNNEVQEDNGETQGDAGYSSVTTVNSEIYATGIANGYKQTARNTQSSGGQTQDNSFQRDGLDTARDKDSQTVPLKPTAAQPTLEGRKSPKQSPHTDMSRLASHHASKLRREGICSVPKPKIILASTDPTKQYTPHCTILHRCGDDVGCCLPTQTCASSKNTTIELYFFVHTVGSRSTIERLSFINHTECACINRLEAVSSTSITPISTVPPPPLGAPVCTCPSLFQRVIDNDNRCFCDCSSSDPQCDQFKRGLEHFSMENRRCIKDGRCEAPVCEYGHYNIAKGKCPTREDKLSYSYKG
ncbi:rho GTPase-activating protein gacZ-like [Wyeomyia smithii]|uniref:rho GTPase-activating protein gacZ-like n=1 Tax=Wyeomyia smithii TaxID=174621 RepID=UPI0024680D13|nr:rho GTPase-activating protein gacZ-like [Wyeomyia smithii]